MAFEPRNVSSIFFFSMCVRMSAPFLAGFLLFPIGHAPFFMTLTTSSSLRPLFWLCSFTGFQFTFVSPLSASPRHIFDPLTSLFCQICFFFYRPGSWPRLRPQRCLFLFCVVFFLKIHFFPLSFFPPTLRRRRFFMAGI